MQSNNLDGAYEYERERRNDELRAAAESQRVHDLLGDQHRRRVSPAVLVGLLVMIIVLLQVL
jgi:hypothetical protein